MVQQMSPDRYFGRLQPSVQSFVEPIIPTPTPVAAPVSTYEISNDLKMTIALMGIALILGIILTYILMKKR
jgi:hypothetical protein